MLMKKKLIYLCYVWVLFITIPWLTTSCWSDLDNPPPALLKPDITSISPESGEPGTVITITGSKFGTNAADVRVRFNNTVDAANILSVSDTEIKVEAPGGFSDHTVNVQVFVSNQLLPSQNVDFYYTERFRPEITSVPATTFYNATLVISGINFSPIAEENTVKFGEIEATVIEASETSLKVIAPDLGDVLSADITVSKADLVSNALSIEVDLDQNTVAKYDWTTAEVRPGITHKNGTFALFGDVQRRINVLDVTLDESNELAIGFSTANAATVSMVNGFGGVAGINAGYFPISGAVDKDPYIRIDGVEVQEGTLSSVSTRFVNAALTINNNIASVRHITGSGNLNLQAAQIPFSEAENVIVCGPILFVDHNHIPQDDNPHNTSSTARTGLGVSADGKRVIMVTVDTGNGVTGVTTPQLGLILEALGAASGMNFDGGGSTTMFAQGFGTNGLVNLPSGGSQRAVRSVVYVK